MRSGNLQRRIADMELQMMQGTCGADWQRCIVLMHGTAQHIEYAQHVTTGERIYDPALVRQMFNPSGKAANMQERQIALRLDTPAGQYRQIITEAHAAGVIADSQIRSMLRISPQGQP